ncbi:MAG: T9SS type A sorting domain-containing protein [Bacteroidetes bacterium]|nr:T9SS type A sorting domain-containing protein [Bacteroidota bacterium]
MLEIAGVDDTFDFSGLSIRELAEPDTMRHFAFYEYEGSEPGDLFDVPDLRGLRGFNKAYFYSNCDCYTEEFYDFTLDPKQNQNQIFNPVYQDEINFYRLKLQEMRLANNDTAPFQINECKLVGAFEIPDGYDNDCDGLIDDSLDAFIQYADLDGDGYGNSDSPLIVFGELEGYVTNDLDCDDTSPFNYPFAVDFCDGLDNDCDLLIDEDVVEPLIGVDGAEDVCTGGLTHLNAKPVYPGYQIQWYRNGFPVVDANHATFDVSKTGNYQVKYTAPAGCITISATKVIMVSTPPSPIVYNVSASNDLCKNNPVKLQVKNKIGNTYQWYKGVMPIAGATTNIYFATTPGFYKVLQSDVNGCAGTSKPFRVVNFCDEGMFTTQTSSMQLFPNPNNGNFILTCNFNNAYTGNAKLLMHNMIGDVVWESEIAVNQGEVNTEINTNNQLPNGMYLVTISVGQWQNNMQFILAH